MSNSSTATIEGVTVSFCGSNDSGAVQVFSGCLKVTGCAIVDNRGDGVVLEDRDQTAELTLMDSLVFRNGAGGVVQFGGTAFITGNRVQSNVASGIRISPENNYGTLFRRVEIVDNVVHGNGNGDVGCMVVVTSTRDLKERVTIKENHFPTAVAMIYGLTTTSELADLARKKKQGPNVSVPKVRTMWLDAVTVTGAVMNPGAKHAWVYHFRILQVESREREESPCSLSW